MDVVYVNKEGENPELRYSLRTLKNVQHDMVWIFGGAPSWINRGEVQHHPRVQRGSPYASVREHIKAACNTADVSDPFMLWNDDFFCMDPIGYNGAVYHRGPLVRMLEQFASTNILWAKGLRETAHMLEKVGHLEGAMSYDLHLPLPIYKQEMREAIRWADKSRVDAVHVRTLYGVGAGLGGVERHDPKMLHRNDPFPKGAWLSSGDATYRSTVEPVLRYLFPDPSPYEKR